MSVESKPRGYSSVSSYLVVKGARYEAPDGSIMHAEARIDDSVVMIADGGGEWPPFPSWLHVYVRDVDATYRRALDAGGVSVQQPQRKQGDPDRRGGVKDPGGNTWWIATQVGMLVLALATCTPVPAQPQELDLCAVMPLADVSAILQSKLGGAGTVTTAQPGAGGMCSYRGEIDGRRTVRLLIDFTDYGSPDRAREAQATLRQLMRERAMAVEDVAGVGDEAFASREGETVGVKVRTRTYGGQVNLDVEEASFEAVKAAATLLAQKVVERLR